MSARSRPTPSRTALVGFTIASVLILAYALLIVQQLLLGIVPIVLVGLGYLVWRVVVALEAIADAAQRIADERERR
mgnify:CR=1 FL=1